MQYNVVMKVSKLMRKYISRKSGRVLPLRTFFEFTLKCLRPIPIKPYIVPYRPVTRDHPRTAPAVKPLTMKRCIR